MADRHLVQKKKKEKDVDPVQQKKKKTAVKRLIDAVKKGKQTKQQLKGVLPKGDALREEDALQNRRDDKKTQAKRHHRATTPPSLPPKKKDPETSSDEERMREEAEEDASTKNSSNDSSEYSSTSASSSSASSGNTNDSSGTGSEDSSSESDSSEDDITQAGTGNRKTAHPSLWDRARNHKGRSFFSSMFKKQFWFKTLQLDGPMHAKVDAPWWIPGDFITKKSLSRFVFCLRAFFVGSLIASITCFAVAMFFATLAAHSAVHSAVMSMLPDGVTRFWPFIGSFAYNIFQALSWLLLGSIFELLAIVLGIAAMLRWDFKKISVLFDATPRQPSSPAPTGAAATTTPNATTAAFHSTRQSQQQPQTYWTEWSAPSPPLANAIPTQTLKDALNQPLPEPFTPAPPVLAQ
jgi:hypothetical protein